MSRTESRYMALLIMVVWISLTGMGCGDGGNDPRQCEFRNILVNGAPYDGSPVIVRWDGMIQIEFDFADGDSWYAETSIQAALWGPLEGNGPGHYRTWIADFGSLGDGTFTVKGTSEGGMCSFVVLVTYS